MAEKEQELQLPIELQIIALGLTPLLIQKVFFKFLEDYLKVEKLSKIIVGEPKRMNNEASTIGLRNQSICK